MPSKKSPKPDAASLAHIAAPLRPLATPIADLIQDPANARLHPDKNLDAIKASLRVYGQRKPLVVNQATGIVEAGNGTLLAAKALGWTHLAAVHVHDDPATAVGFAIADNRAAELAAWDHAALGPLLAAVETEDPELRRMLDELGASGTPAGAKAADPEVLGDPANTAATPYLRFGDAEVPMSHEEADRLHAHFSRFTAEHGTSFGFVTWMLDHVSARL